MAWAKRPQSAHYDATHRALRAELAPAVERGEVDCWRCHERIQAGEAWVLGHSEDRSRYEGPEHRRCSDQSGARTAGSRSWVKRERIARPGEAHPGLL